jgi:hypothetical protein
MAAPLDRPDAARVIVCAIGAPAAVGFARIPVLFSRTSRLLEFRSWTRAAPGSRRNRIRFACELAGVEALSATISSAASTDATCRHLHRYAIRDHRAQLLMSHYEHLHYELQWSNIDQGEPRVLASERRVAEDGLSEMALPLAPPKVFVRHGRAGRAEPGPAAGRLPADARTAWTSDLIRFGERIRYGGP